MLYQKLLKPIFFKFDPENVHNFFVWFGGSSGNSKFCRKLISFFYKYEGKDISKKINGLFFKTPFILSAGFDYNGRLLNILPEISFGSVEVGSITARTCPGNPKPRLKRLIKSQSILVNKGLCNDGVDAVIQRLKKYKKRDDFVVGISIAKTNDKGCVTVDDGLEDYFYSFKRLIEEDVGDYYTINISCPNAYGGETFTKPESLDLLISRLSSVQCFKPVYVKMPINLEWSEFDNLLKVLNKFEIIKGVIIGNLNKDYDSLEHRSEAPQEYRGGLSGKPCFEISNDLIRKTRNAYGKRFTIIGCGGVLSPDDMAQKFAAGSDLVALMTGIIYNGPGFIKTLSNYYANHLIK